MNTVNIPSNMKIIQKILHYAYFIFFYKNYYIHFEPIKTLNSFRMNL